MNYTQALQRTIEVWNSAPIEDEWVFEKFRKNYVAVMTPHEAFSSIGPTAEVMLVQSDESTAIEILQTLISLARQSNTTEIPPTLLTSKLAFEEKFSEFGDYAKGKLRELLSYYRL
jgi:hypothetical protein